MVAEQQENGSKLISANRKARFQYQIVETFEAGIVLTGSEIKSVRAGKVQLGESYVRPQGGELWLIQAHISQYLFDADKNYDPVRKRKLLMKRREIDQLRVKVEQKGLTLIPLSIYLKRGLAKIELALAKGKAAPDKREAVKEREATRETKRAIKMQLR